MTEPINVEEGLKLLDCPFCGKPPRTCPDTSYGDATVFCPDANDCPVQPQADADLNAGETLAHAIARWNTRALASQQQLAEAVEVLRRIADESIFNQQRFAEDTDTDYFLRCFKAVKDRARDFLTKHRREG